MNEATPINQTTSVTYSLVLSEQKITSLTTFVGLLPKVYQLPDDPEDEKAERRELLEARFHIAGIAFTCLSVFINPNNETENIVIGKLEDDKVHGNEMYAEKFLASLKEIVGRTGVKFQELSPDLVKEFLNTYKELLSKPCLEEV